jgi:UPF0271 protein
MNVIDLNADIGEAETPDGIASELAILSYVSSANIACGGHRGDAESMTRTVKAAFERGVAIGAHPAYPDRENFGRSSMTLGQDISQDSLTQTLHAQITALIQIAQSCGAQVSYVKPHGALYNDSVRNRDLAELIVSVIKNINPALGFMGAPQSEMTKAAAAHGLRFIAEGFIDRRYTDDGHLQSRKITGAVIKDHAQRMAQTRALVTTGEIETAAQNIITLKCDSLCLHGDSPDAVKTARYARGVIEAAGVAICAVPLPANSNAARGG